MLMALQLNRSVPTCIGHVVVDSLLMVISNDSSAAKTGMQDSIGGCILTQFCDTVLVSFRVLA